MLAGMPAKRIWTVVGLTVATLVAHGLQQQPTSALSRGGDKRRVEAKAEAPSIDVADQATNPKSALTTQDGPITLTAHPDRTTVLNQSAGLVHVALDVHAKPAVGEEAQHRPTDMMVVLDISGSMSGEKLSHAKFALHQLIDHLTSVDRFALVTYESGARVEVPFTAASGGALKHFRRVVDRLETAGGTNMSAGIDLALPLLRESRGKGRSARVLLLSDGHANEGDSSPAGLAARARKVVQLEDVMSTMGVGDDFNEDLMTALADRGTGNFYYLSRTQTLGHFFKAELRAASMTVASAVELHFEPESGVELVELGGYPMEQQGGHWLVRPGNLFAGQERRLWATIRVPVPGGETVKLGQFSLHYRHEDRFLAAKAPSLPALIYTADRSTFEHGIEKAIWEEFVSEEAYEQAQNAMGHAIAKGDAADVDREYEAFRENRALAASLGSGRVLSQIEAMADEADKAKSAQQLPAPARAIESKQKKAKSLFRRRGDAYMDDPLIGL